MGSYRSGRLDSQFKQEIYDVIQKQLRNNFPQLCKIISVTEVDVSRDLKNARVYVSIFDADKNRVNESFDILKKNAGFIRFELSKTMRIRSVPELRFVLDGSQEYGAHINALLNSIDIKDEEDE